MLYSKNGEFPISRLPFRIKLSDGRTRTDPSTFTPEEIADAGYVAVENPPNIGANQVLTWTGLDWHVRDKTEEELANEVQIRWYDVRAHRDRLLSEIDWRYMRYHSQVRLGLTPTDDIAKLDTYAQALRDITLQPDPYNIIWPNLEH